MSGGYSYDLRLKIMTLVEEDMKVKDASKTFQISRKAIIEWKKLKKATGDLRAKTGYHTGHRKIITDIEGFKKFIDQNNGKSGAELAKLWPQKISSTTIVRSLKRLGYSYKKNFLSSQKGYWIKS